MVTARAAEPALRRAIDSFSIEIAQKRYAVSFNYATKALWTRLIVDREPKERHRPDANAYFFFKQKLALPDLLPRKAKLSSSLRRILADSPRSNVIANSRRPNSFADQVPED
jgi:hypothetical protein